MMSPTPMNANLSTPVMATPVNFTSTTADIKMCTAITTVIQTMATRLRNGDFAVNSHGLDDVTAWGSRALRYASSSSLSFLDWVVSSDTRFSLSCLVYRCAALGYQEPATGPFGY